MKRVFGSILMAVGILIAGASGLCSAILVIGTFKEFGMGALIYLSGGAIPFGIGLAAFFGGRALVRQAKSEATKATKGTLQEPREQQPTTPSSPQKP